MRFKLRLGQFFKRIRSGRTRARLLQEIQPNHARFSKQALLLLIIGISREKYTTMDPMYLRLLMTCILRWEDFECR